MTKKIQIKNWADKNITFVYTAEMAPLGRVECFCATEFKAYRADETFIGWFDTKRKAVAAL